jgi:hypothetical protein
MEFLRASAAAFFTVKLNVNLEAARAWFHRPWITKDSFNPIVYLVYHIS